MILPLPAPVPNPAGSGSGSPSGCPSVDGRPCSVSSQTAPARWLGAFTCQRSDVSRAGPGWAGEGSVPMVPRGASLEIRGTAARVAGSLGAARTCVMLGGRGSWGTLAQRSDLSQPSRTACARWPTLFVDPEHQLPHLDIVQGICRPVSYIHTQTYHYSLLDFLICPFFSHSLGRLFKCAEVAGTPSLVFPSLCLLLRATSSAFGVPQCRGQSPAPIPVCRGNGLEQASHFNPPFHNNGQQVHAHTYIHKLLDHVVLTTEHTGERAFPLSGGVTRGW